MISNAIPYCTVFELLLYTKIFFIPIGMIIIVCVGLYCKWAPDNTPEMLDPKVGKSNNYINNNRNAKHYDNTQNDHSFKIHPLIWLFPSC